MNNPFTSPFSMPPDLKDNEREARERLRAFWAGTSCGRRPALGVTAGSPDREATRSPWSGTASRKERELLADYQVWACAPVFSGVRYLAESFPGVKLDWGTALVTVAAFAGGDYDFEAGSAWIKPIPDLWSRPLPHFSPRHPLVPKLEAIFDALSVHVGHRALITPPLLLDGLTTLSMFRETPLLCTELMDRPDDVRRWSSALTRLGMEIYEHFYRFLGARGYTDTASWLAIAAEGRMEAVQCDFAAMLSPAQFREFVMPDLRRMVEYLDFSLYHLDGVEQMRFLDLLREIEGLNGIQWNPQPQHGRELLKWVEAFREIRKRKFSLFIWCRNEPDTAVTLARELGPDGLYLDLGHFDSVDEAESVIRRIEKAV